MLENIPSPKALSNLNSNKSQICFKAIIEYFFSKFFEHG